MYENLCHIHHKTAFSHHHQVAFEYKISSYLEKRLKSTIPILCNIVVAIKIKYLSLEEIAHNNLQLWNLSLTMHKNYNVRRNTLVNASCLKNGSLSRIKNERLQYYTSGII